MPTISLHLETPIHRSFRVEQVAGMFDVPMEERLRHEVVAEVPGMEEEWTIGAIVGPSGSGKTTLAKAAFGGKLWKRRPWPNDKSLIDCFGDVPVKTLTLVLSSVGLGSPPTWLKPYDVLSTGEKFRAELARAVMGSGRILTQRRKGAEKTGERECGARLVVVDEFTGSLDRTVAKTTSTAFGRLLRGLKDSAVPLRFVAVTCHRDILPWLSPDWVVEVGREVGRMKEEGGNEEGVRGEKCVKGEKGEKSVKGGGGESLAYASGLCGRLTWGRPEKPSFRFSVERVPQAMWTRFSGEHYLSGGLAASATCYAALWNQEPIGFCAVAASLGWKATKRIQRLVVLPEFQGMGIGGKLLDETAAIEANKGIRVSITASHPAVLAHCSKSARWRLIGLKKNGSTRQRFEGREVGSSVGRAVVAFEFCGGSIAADSDYSRGCS